MGRIMVTGLSGFTGRYLARALLAQGYDVVGIGLHPAGDNVPFTVCDLVDPESTRAAVAHIRPERVIHLAAVSFVDHSNPEAFYRVNVLGTVTLMEALGKLGTPPEKVIVASSANVYGAPNVEDIDETICPAPVNHYACSKLAMEHMVRIWFDRLPLVIVRPFNYTGPGQNKHFLIPKIVTHFVERQPVIELGNLEVQRDFSDVLDIVDAYLILLRNEVRLETVNICSGKATSLKTVIAMMSRIAGYEIEIRVNPAFVRTNEIRSLKGSYAKLHALTGWRPKRHLEETLQRMYQLE